MRARPDLALLASPLLGPAVWSRVARRLAADEWTVVVPPRPASAPRTPSDVLAEFLRALPADRDLVLVPHSNAGLYVPALGSERRVVASVFVDAGLPPASGDVPLAPPALASQLAARAGEDGLLPPWTEWWPAGDVAALFPDAAAQALVAREQHRLPLSYFGASLTVPPGWDGVPGAYLAFGDTYARERSAAAERGWPGATLPGRHLHMLVHPEAVAAAVVSLLAAAGRR